MKSCLSKGVNIVLGATGALLMQRPGHEMQMKRTREGESIDSSVLTGGKKRKS